MTSQAVGRRRLLSVFGQDTTTGWFRYLIASFHNKVDDVQWDDLKFPATSGKQGALDKPDFDYTNLGLLFPQNDTAEKIYMIGQMPHAWKVGTNIKPHIHYAQDESDTPTFKLNYRITENGSAVGSFTTITSTTAIFTYTSGTIIQILPFPAIDMSAVDSVSAVLELILWRDDNDVTGDVLFKEFDLHYQIDSNGSDNEYTK